MSAMEYAIALDFAMMVVLLLIASAQHRKDVFDTGMNANLCTGGGLEPRGFPLWCLLPRHRLRSGVEIRSASIPPQPVG